jgi:hypothetical protein
MDGDFGLLLVVGDFLDCLGGAVFSMSFSDSSLLLFLLDLLVDRANDSAVVDFL